MRKEVFVNTGQWLPRRLDIDIDIIGNDRYVELLRCLMRQEVDKCTGTLLYAFGGRVAAMDSMEVSDRWVCWVWWTTGRLLPLHPPMLPLSPSLIVILYLLQAFTAIK